MKKSKESKEERRQKKKKTLKEAVKIDNLKGNCETEQWMYSHIK